MKAHYTESDATGYIVSAHDTHAGIVLIGMPVQIGKGTSTYDIAGVRVMS